jgi:NAD(P)-dependent dehydrogenase (short-subunit alcohol dehydrogenase family)
MSERPVALVTGGARRIGRAIALELAAHGWDVALHYRESAAEAQATAGRIALAGRPGRRASPPTSPTRPPAVRCCPRCARTSAGCTRW